MKQEGGYQGCWNHGDVFPVCAIGNWKELELKSPDPFLRSIRPTQPLLSAANSEPKRRPLQGRHHQQLGLQSLGFGPKVLHGGGRTVSTTTADQRTSGRTADQREVQGNCWNALTVTPQVFGFLALASWMPKQVRGGSTIASSDVENMRQKPHCFG